MRRRLEFLGEAVVTLEQLRADPSQSGRYRQVTKILGYMETNLRHPSLQTHKYQSRRGSNGEEVFEAYSQQHTPGAYRVFFFYGPDKVTKKKRTPVLTIFAIVPHP